MYPKDRKITYAMQQVRLASYEMYLCYCVVHTQTHAHTQMHMCFMINTAKSRVWFLAAPCDLETAAIAQGRGSTRGSLAR